MPLNKETKPTNFVDPCLLIIYLINMYKPDFGLNNLQWLICHKIQPNQIIYLIYMYKEDLALNNLQWLIYHKTQPNQIIYLYV